MRYLRPTLLIEPNAFFRHGLQHILSQTRFRCCQVTSKIEHIHSKTISSRASLCILGIGDDWSPLFDAIHRIRATNATLPVVALCPRYDDDDKIMAALEAGVTGILTKDASSEKLIKSLELIACGEYIVPMCFLKRFMARKPSASIAQQPVAQATDPVMCNGPSDQAGRCLSEREEATLRHIMRGDANKVIAHGLRVSEATVKVHVKAILRKIRVKNRTQAAIWAIQNLRSNGSESPQYGRDVAQPIIIARSK